MRFLPNFASSSRTVFQKIPHLHKQSHACPSFVKSSSSSSKAFRLAKNPGAPPCTVFQTTATAPIAPDLSKPKPYDINPTLGLVFSFSVRFIPSGYLWVYTFYYFDFVYLCVWRPKSPFLYLYVDIDPSLLLTSSRIEIPPLL